MAQYWNKADDELVLKWNVCSCQREESKLYQALTPKFNKVINNITNRYFSIRSNREEILGDCLIHVFLQLRKTEIKPNQNIFGLVGFIVKNYLKNVLVFPDVNTKVLKSSLSFDTPTDDGKGKNLSLHEVISDTIPESCFDEVLDVLNHKELELIQTIKDKLKADKKAGIELLTQDLELIKLFKEFLSISIDFELRDLFEYIEYNTDMKQSTITSSFRRCFNQTYRVDKYDHDKMDNKLKQVMDVCIDDDYTPRINSARILRRRNYIRNVVK